MLLDNSQYSLKATTEVSTDSTSIPQASQQPLPTLYDYLGLLPGLITAITPLMIALILELRKKSSASNRHND